MADISKITLPDGVEYDIKDSTARSSLTNLHPMVVLSYGISTWDDFIAVYQTNSVVYCRASSNSNPATGAQGRMAFMAYVNNGDNPTEVEFQYYRSVSSHSATQQGDQVFVYKLNKTSGWSVTIREAVVKTVAGTGLNSSYSSNNLTLSLKTASTANLGGVKVDGTSIIADSNGIISASTTGLVTISLLQAALPSPLSSYHNTIGNGSDTSFTISHYLNTKNIIISINITDNNVTYIAPMGNLLNSSQIGYNVTINSNDSITINFSSAPPIDGAEISIVSAIAYSTASDENYLRIS